MESNLEDILEVNIVDEDKGEDGTPKKKDQRPKKSLKFERDPVKRKRADRDKKKSLQKKLDEWHEVTRYPVVALGLEIKEEGGEMLVRYFGPPALKEFAENPEVQRVFKEVVLKGIGSNTHANVQGNDEGIPSYKCLDESLVDILKKHDVLSFTADGKRKLIGALVTNNGRISIKRAWKAENRPPFWPVAFLSPNVHSTETTVEKMNLVLKSYINWFAKEQSKEAPNVGEMSATIHNLPEHPSSACGLNERKRRGPVLPPEQNEHCSPAKGHSKKKLFALWDEEDCEALLIQLDEAKKEELGATLDQVPELKFSKNRRRTLTASQENIDLCYRHMLPEELRSGGYQPLLITRDNNSVFRAVCSAVISQEASWPRLKVACIKYAFQNEEEIKNQDIFSEVFTSRTFGDAFFNLMKLGEIADPRLGLLLASKVLQAKMTLIGGNGESQTFGKEFEREYLFLFSSSPYPLLVPLIKQANKGVLSDKPGICALGTNCAKRVNLENVGELVPCQMCLLQFHTHCASIDSKMRNDEGQWKCGCHIRRVDLRSIQKFHDASNMKNMLNVHDAKLREFVAAIRNGTVYSRRMVLWQRRGMASMIRDSFGQHCWLLSDRSADPIMEYTGRLISDGELLPDVPFASELQLRADVLLPELMSYLLHLEEEELPLVRARQFVLDV